VETTPVVLTPILTRQKAPEIDYFESFQFTDLVIPQIANEEFLSLMQVYFPTKEITGRIIAQLPKVLHKTIARRLFFVLQFFFKRIAIGMIFLESKKLDGISIDMDEVKKALKWYRIKFKNSGLIIFPFFKKYLLNGASYHLGAVHFEDEESKGINSELFEILATKGVHLVDTSILPKLPPGPHTSIAAAYSKLIVRKAIS
jgi:hypothetical protein